MNTENELHKFGKLWITERSTTELPAGKVGGAGVEPATSPSEGTCL